MISTLFKLLFGHALADFALQPQTMAHGKNRNRKPDLNLIPKGQKYVSTWFYWLGSHALIHGGMAYLATGNVVCGIIETCGHFIIDFLKCENVTNPHMDQFLHLLMKLSYIFKMGVIP